MKRLRPLTFLHSGSNPLLPKAISIGLACFIIAGVLFIPQPADALFGVDIGGITEKVAAGFMSTAVWGLLWMLGWIGWAALVLGTVVLEAVMSFVLQAHYTPLTAKGEGVEIGWLVIRDFTNMLFILVLIAIGVGTMLRLRIRGAVMGPQLLIPFALIAILINFTPLLTGIVIDIANILTKFFFDSVGNGMNAFINENPFRDLGEFSPTGNLSTAAASIFKLAVGIVFNLVEALIFLMVSALLVIRVLALWLLVIFSPLAFLLYILPQTRQYFEKWWSQFLQWAMLPVPIGFFIWLSVIIMQNGSTQCGSLTVSVTPGGGYEGAAGSVLAGTAFCDAVISAMALGTLLAGMFAAFAVSAAGSGFIVSQGKAARAGTQRWANRRRQQATGAAGRGVRAGAVGVADRAGVPERAGQLGQRIQGSGLAQRRYVGAPVRAIGENLSRVQTQRRTEWKRQSKQFQDTKDMPAPAQITRIMSNRNDPDKLVAAWESADRNTLQQQLQTLPAAQRNQLVQQYVIAASNRGGTGVQDWLNINPQDAQYLPGAAPGAIAERVENLEKNGLQRLTENALEYDEVGQAWLDHGEANVGVLRRYVRTPARIQALNLSLSAAIDGRFGSNDYASRIAALRGSGDERLDDLANFIENDPALRAPGVNFLG